VVGRPAVISFITMAELRYGARLTDWGAAQLRLLEARLSTAETVWPQPELVDMYVELRTACARIGHALAQKVHEGDRWLPRPRCGWASRWSPMIACSWACLG
jgi:predicted nucleic acid-binding protein